MPKVNKNVPFPRNLLDVVFNNGEAPNNTYNENEFIDYAFTKLSDIQKKIIIYRFKDNLSMREVAKLINRTTETVRANEIKSIRKMRNCLSWYLSKVKNKTAYAYTLDEIRSNISAGTFNSIKRGFSKRGFNSAMEITINDIIEVIEDGSINSFRNFGKGRLNEIVTFIQNLGINVKIQEGLLHDIGKFSKDELLIKNINVLNLPRNIENRIYQLKGRNFTIKQLIDSINDNSIYNIYGIGDIKVKYIKEELKKVGVL